MPTDLEKARKIAYSKRRLVGVGGSLRDNVARAVAEGIALGRREGLEIAAEAIKAQLVEATKKSN